MDTKTPVTRRVDGAETLNGWVYTEKSGPSHFGRSKRRDKGKQTESGNTPGNYQDFRRKVASHLIVRIFFEVDPQNRTVSVLNVKFLAGI